MYAQVQAAEPTLITNLYNRWTAHCAKSPNLHGTVYRSVLGAFSGIKGDWSRELSDQRVAQMRFASPPVAAAVTGILGHNNSHAFL